MLAIRMQRTGRKGHAMYRVVVQDSRRTPTSGKVVASIGSYDPHTKIINLVKEKASFYLEHGAQPSDRVVKLFISEGVKLPDWVSKPSKDKKRAIRNAEKLRRNRPAEPVEPAAEKAEEQPAADAAVASSEETETAEREAVAVENAEAKTDSQASDDVEAAESKEAGKTGDES